MSIENEMELKDKPLFNEQVEIVASKLNIPNTTVKAVLKAYINLLAKEIFMGMEVRLGYILRIEPSELKNNYLATTGYESYVISNSSSVPYNTVLTILTTYLDLIVDSLKEGKNFNVVGLVRLSSDISSGEVKVYTNISKTITDSLNSKNMKVRVKLNKNLRHLFKTGVA